MKTTTNYTAKFPTTGKLILFVLLMSGLCFLSCFVSKAQGFTNMIAYYKVDASVADYIASTNRYSAANTLAYRLSIALIEETEEEIVLEDWMTDFNYTRLNLDILEEEATEEEMEVEPWMLDFNAGVQTFEFLNIEAETELETEEWMLDVDEFVTAEDEVELESWMLGDKEWMKAIYRNK